MSAKHERISDEGNIVLLATSLLLKFFLSADMLGAAAPNRQWRSFLKNLAVGQVVDWAKSCCCVFELKTISTER
jgi:hypothetical protein